MYLKALRLRHFRIFKDLYLYFSPKVNSIIGKNAKGKTTLLEAVYFLSTGRSFRTNNLEDLIQEGKDGLEVEAVFTKHGVDHTLRLFWSKAKKKVIYNRTESSNFGMLFGVLLSVPLIPEDIDLIKGQPQKRRQYLDLLIAKTDPLYVRHILRFERALKQRNALLKDKKIDGIEGFEKEMAKSSCYIVSKRSLAICHLSESLKQVYASFGDSEERLDLRYQTQFHENPEKEEFHFELFAKSRKRDLVYGVTTFGPQKDNFILEINGKESRFFGSEGQKRSVAAALRLSEWELLKKMQLIDPLILIDDLGLGFDKERKKRFLDTLKERSFSMQTMLTATESSHFDEAFLENAYITL